MSKNEQISEKPIPFSAPMVRAILDGRRSMTRLVVKPQPNSKLGNGVPSDAVARRPYIEFPHIWTIESRGIGVRQYEQSTPFSKSDAIEYWRESCPYGKPGDRLWVQETFSEIPNQKPAGYFTDPKWIDRKYWYEADNDKPTWGGKWKPPIFMPRDACRILLEITDIRAERLQEITEEDAIAEGVTFDVTEEVQREDMVTPGRDSCAPVLIAPKDAFLSLWDSINKERGFGWDQNPWVWVIEFKKLEV